MNHLVLIDANSLIHRAYHAMPKDMQNRQGELIGAVFGFTKALLLAIKDLKPTHLAAAFDLGEPTFRHQKYELYKANRQGMESDLYQQLPRIKEILTALNIPFFEKEGFEADDLIGTLAIQAAKDQKTEVMIVTGDLDTLQLVSGKQVAVWTPSRGEIKSFIYDESKVVERFGFGPALVVDYKALRGDPSDNIPGVSGIGEKTAAALVLENGPIESLYQALVKNPEEIKAASERIKEKLIAEKEVAFLSKELATIDCLAPIKLDLAACQVSDYDREHALAIFAELQFNSLVKDLPPTHRLSTSSSSLFAAPPTELSESEKIDQKLEPILRQMETVGVKIDPEQLWRLEKKLEQECKKISTKIFLFAGENFNLDSPSQLAEIFFEKLKLPTEGLKKGKAGHFPTDAATLEKMAKITPIASLVLCYRELAKLLNTYIKPLSTLVNSKKRIHTHWAPDTATGRISSREPNLQNIPTRTAVGRQIRQAFVADSGNLLLAADYSQIELRVIAHLAQDQTMIKAFRDGFDIHKATAEKMNVNRQIAKTINFSILYGKRAFGLADDLHISRQAAAEFIEAYFKSYPGVKKFIDKIIDGVRTDGFAETMFGKRRSFPDILSENQYLRAAAEREAVNHPIQGTAAEILKLAMINLTQKKIDGQLILTIHDELVFEIPESRLTQSAKIIKETMEEAIHLDVPLVVEIKSGKNWGQLN